MALQKFLTVSALALAACGICSLSAAESTPSPVNDTALIEQFYNIPIQMPEKIFTEEQRAAFRGKETPVNGTGDGTKPPVWNAFFTFNTTWATADQRKIKPEAWKTIFSGIPPMTISRSGGICPFCKKKFRGVRPSITDADPSKSTTYCCNKTVYADLSKAPADYAARPNRKVTLPLMDGSTREFEFYSAGNDPKDFFNGAMEIELANLELVLYHLMPRLEGAWLRRGDAKAAGSLIAILNRLAEIAPSYPLANFKKPFGFAREKDLIPGGSDAYLTRDAWQKEVARRRTGNARISTWQNGGFSRFPYNAGYNSDGYMIAGGYLAEAWEAVRDFPGLDLNHWETVRQKLILPECDLFFWQEPCLINMMEVYFRSALKMAIVGKDPQFHEKIFPYYAGLIWNFHFEDGGSTEGSFNYVGMQGGYLGNPWIAQQYFGVDLEARFPIARRIREVGIHPVVTLRGVESCHGDEHTAFFASRHVKYRANPDYDANKTAQNFPFYGLSAMRGGKAGSRLETIVDFQNQLMHGHDGRLNLQLFYEGVNLMPDIGYCTKPADLKKSPWKDFKSAYPVVEPPKDRAMTPVEHCTATIDGHQWDKWTFEQTGWIGDEGGFVRYLAVDGTASYRKHPDKVDAFRRRVAVVEFSDGRPCLLDFFQLKGGKRHELAWHVAGERTSDNAGKVAAPNFYEFCKKYCDPAPEYRREDEYIFTRYFFRTNPEYRREGTRWLNPAVSPAVKGFRTTSWLVDPAKILPETFGNNTFQPWRDGLPKVNLKLHSAAVGSPAQSRFVQFRGDWASNAMASETYAQLISLDNALDFEVFQRQGGKAGLQSLYLSVLEPYTTGETPVLKNLELLEGSADKAVLKLTSISGETMEITVDFANAPGAPEFAVKSSAGQEISYGAKPFTGKLTAFAGDLTGEPEKSELTVAFDGDLPEDALAPGRYLQVHHATSPDHVSIYRIGETESLGGGAYRITLADNPPFIQHRFRVISTYKSEVRLDMRTFAGVERPFGIGRKVRFPKTNWESTVTGHRVEGYAGWWARHYKLAELIPADVKPEDPVICYSIGIGDKVSIPDFNANTGK